VAQRASMLGVVRGCCTVPYGGDRRSRPPLLGAGNGDVENGWTACAEQA